MASQQRVSGGDSVENNPPISTISFNNFQTIVLFSSEQHLSKQNNTPGSSSQRMEWADNNHNNSETQTTDFHPSTGFASDSDEDNGWTTVKKQKGKALASGTTESTDKNTKKPGR